MKTRLTILALVAMALAALAVACGGAGPKVTVEKGLAAAVGQYGEGQAAPEAASQASAVGAETGASAAVPGALGTRAGMSAPYALGGAFAPSAQAAAAGLTVQGYGRATAPADSARVQFVVSKSGEIYPKPLPAEPGAVPEGGVESEIAPATPPEIYPTPISPSPITEADLKPLMDAIKAQGVSDADIEVVIYPSGYYDPYGSGSAGVTVTLRDPADRVGALVDAGTQAVNESGTLMLQNVGVLYSVDDCSALLREARRAAVEDGRENGAGLADALGVSLGDILSASEYTYAPFGPSPCDPSFDTYYGYGYEGSPYDPAMPAEVQIVSNVSISFSIR